MVARNPVRTQMSDIYKLLYTLIMYPKISDLEEESLLGFKVVIILLYYALTESLIYYRKYILQITQPP